MLKLSNAPLKIMQVNQTKKYGKLWKKTMVNFDHLLSLVAMGNCTSTSTSTLYSAQSFKLQSGFWCQGWTWVYMRKQYYTMSWMYIVHVPAARPIVIGNLALLCHILNMCSEVPSLNASYDQYYTNLPVNYQWQQQLKFPTYKTSSPVRLHRVAVSVSDSPAQWHSAEWEEP